MARVIRPRPRRSPNLYPIGTTLTLRDGRTFEVIIETHAEWGDPSEGNGGPLVRFLVHKKAWRQVHQPASTEEKA